MIQLITFGGFQVCRDGKIVDVRLGKAPQRLLVFLLLSNGRVVTRHQLVDLFYPNGDYEKACLALNTSVWRLKRWNEKYLGEFSSKLISMRGELAMEVADTSFFDRDQFIRLSEPCQQQCARTEPISDDEATSMRAASELYTGAFLQGDKTQWVAAERDKLRIRYVRLQDTLMRYQSARCDWEEALAHGRKLLEVDPLREDIHREMMMLYARCGQRAAALRQFEECRALMFAECGLAPLPDTFSVLEKVRKGCIPPALSEPTPVQT